MQFLVIGLLGCRRERVEPAASVPDASAAPVAVVADAAVEPPGLRLVATTASYNANYAVDEQTSFRALYARAPDDIWAIGDRAIFHAGGAGPTPPVVRLPTRADVRVELQNEHLPMSWNRDCDAVFVELAAGMAVDAGASVDREKMADVLGRSSSLEWQLVTGRLYDREVAGVVVSRGAYDLPRETMNAKIERLVETFTRDPMNVPQVHCTLPVLATVVGSRR